jgi:hypothetical protein
MFSYLYIIYKNDTISREHREKGKKRTMDGVWNLGFGTWNFPDKPALFDYGLPGLWSSNLFGNLVTQDGIIKLIKYLPLTLFF